MSFWKKKKPQHPPASSLLGTRPQTFGPYLDLSPELTLMTDDPVSDQEISSLPPPALPTPVSLDLERSDLPILDTSNRPPSPETTPSPPLQSPSSPSKRLSRFNPFRRNSSKSGMDGRSPSPSGETSPKSNPVNSSGIKTSDPSDPRTLSPQPRPRNRTPSASPYASPRTSVYGALSSPSSSSNPGEIFERSIESVPSVSTQSPSVKGVPTHQVLEDIIPPALEATAATFTDHINPDNVEIVTFSEVQSSDSRSNAGSPVPSSPTISAPLEATQNPWEADISGSPDLDGKKRTLSLMSAVDHLADEMIHPALPASVDRKAHHAPSPLSLSPAIKPADVPGVRTAMSDLNMERSPSQASMLGDVVVMKQTMGDALRHQRLSTVGHSGEGSPSIEPQPSGRREALESNPWNT
jgi:hypothetical protein